MLAYLFAVSFCVIYVLFLISDLWTYRNWNRNWEQTFYSIWIGLWISFSGACIVVIMAMGYMEHIGYLSWG